MRKYSACVLLLLSYSICTAQNLIPNGDFEQYTNCPYANSQLAGFVDDWFNPTNGPPFAGSPDYYNQCDNPGGVGVPDNGPGYQPAHSGGAYVGIYLTQLVSNVREYIETPLTTPLVANTCYHFEMYVNVADDSKYTTDAIQVYFSNTIVTGYGTFYVLPLTPQVSNAGGNIFDSVNWTLVSGDYTASGGESYLVIGNFKNDSATTTILMNNSAWYNFVYSFIDDVSLVANQCTGINEYEKTLASTIYPNPVTDQQLKLSYSLQQNKSGVFEMFDTKGSKVYSMELPSGSSGQMITLPKISGGLYQCIITSGMERVSKKIAVINK